MPSDEALNALLIARLERALAMPEFDLVEIRSMLAAATAASRAELIRMMRRLDEITDGDEIR